MAVTRFPAGVPLNAAEREHKLGVIVSKWSFLSCLMLACAVGGLAEAQQPEADYAAEKAVALDLASQPLQDALHQFSVATGLKVMFLTELGRGIVSPHVSGTLTPGVALGLLLKGSDLRFKYLDSQTIAVLPAHEPQGDSPVRPTSRVDTDPVKTAASNVDGGVGSTTEHGAKGAQQTPGGAESAANSSAKRLEDIQEVVVTAQKREERLQNVPISISVLGGAELDRSTAQGVSDALSTVPGVATSANYLGSGTSVVIRGVQAAGSLFTGSSAVAYYLDSVPFGLIRSAIAPDENAFDLERIEVLRGPQGTLYGASALNGVVRVLSSDPDLQQFDLKARVSSSVTQYGGDNYRGDLAVNIPIVGDLLAARAVLGYENNAGWIDQPNKKDVNDAQLRNYRIKLKAQPTEDLTVGLSAWSSRDNLGAPSIGYTYNKSSSVLDQPVVTDFDAYGLKVENNFAGYLLSSLTSYLDYKNEASLDLAPYGFEGSIFFSGLNSNAVSEELNLSSPRDGKWRWSVGAIYTRRTENLYQTYSVIDVPPETVDMLSKSYAVYGEITRLLCNDRLEVTAGVRHFHDDVTQMGQLAPDQPFMPASGTFAANTPRVVLTWHLDERHMVYGSYSQGFRGGFPQDPTVPSDYPPVQPDRLRNFEMGSKGSLIDGLLSYDTSVYYMKWNGIQQQLYVPYLGVPAGAIAVVNAQSASGVGVDLAASMEPVRGLILRLNGSWNNLGMDTDVLSGGVILFNKGNRPNYSPQTTAGLAAEYRFPLGGHGYTGHIETSVNYVSRQSYRALQNGGAPDAFALVQRGDPLTTGRVSLSLVAPRHWQASLFVDNVTNERGSPIDAFAGVPDWAARVRPRTAGLQLEYGFR